ncbi:MAG: hypothetical protein LBJ38_02625 [Oscillospiraceae bacterium]|nr:hypothetical protein [Oscillospiraceae bacterium]
MKRRRFLPVLLGTDLNAYGMARAFYEEYKIKSVVVGEFHLLPTRYSAIIDARIFESFGTQSVFLAALSMLYKEYHEDFEDLLLVACGDDYVRLVVENRSFLEERFIVPCVGHEVFDKLSTKEGFYKACDQFGLRYPETCVITPTHRDVELPFEFPVVLKASNSMKYARVDFEGKEKVYFVNTRRELDLIVEKVYRSRYAENLLVQRMVAGDDDNMRVLNCYVGKDGKVKLMCLGQVLIEDKDKATVGNYLAIMNDYNPALCEKIKIFLETIGYTGFANFDLKFDQTDGEFKFFEINLRQGRSSFFVTGSGFNLAKYLVKDRILNEELDFEIAKAEHVWFGIPKKLAFKYIGAQNKQKVMQLVREKRFCNTLSYLRDINPLRWAQSLRIYGNYWLRQWEGRK